MPLTTDPIVTGRRALLTRRGFCAGLAAALAGLCLPAASAARATLGCARLGSGTLGDPSG